MQESGQLRLQEPSWFVEDGLTRTDKIDMDIGNESNKLFFNTEINDFLASVSCEYYHQILINN